MMETASLRICRCCLAATILVLMLPPVLADERPDQQSASLSHVKNVTRQRNQRLESLYVAYRIRSQVLGAKADAKRYMGIVAEIDETKTFAFKGRKRYFHLERKSSSYVDIAPGVAPRGRKAERVVPPGLEKARSKAKEETTILVDREMISAFDGDQLRRMYVDDKTVQIFGDFWMKNQSSDLGEFSYEYLTTVFWALPDAYDNTRSRDDRRLPDVLTKPGVVLRPSKEAIDGVACYRVDVGDKAKLWLDPERSFVVRRWEYLEPQTGRVLWRNDMKSFRQVLPDVWFPETCVRWRWATSRAPRAAQQQPLMRYDLVVNELHANDVPDSLFALQIPAGTTVVDFENYVDRGDRRQSLIYEMPADKTTLDEVIAQTRAEQGRTVLGLVPGVFRGWLIALNLAVVVVVVILLLRRRSRQADRAA